MCIGHFVLIGQCFFLLFGLFGFVCKFQNGEVYPIHVTICFVGQGYITCAFCTVGQGYITCACCTVGQGYIVLLPATFDTLFAEFTSIGMSER